MAKKKGKSKKKKLGYSKIKDFVNPDIAIIQACSLLDIAAIKAIQSGDSSQMAVVSHGWLEVGGVLAGLGNAAEEAEQHDLSSQHEMGFRGDPEPEDEDVEDRAPMGFRRNI